MFCPKCGKINPDNSEICSGCNTPLHDENDEKNTPEKKIKWGKIVLAAVIVAVAAVVVAIVLSGCGNATIPEESITF